MKNTETNTGQKEVLVNNAQMLKNLILLNSTINEDGFYIEDFYNISYDKFKIRFQGELTNQTLQNYQRMGFEFKTYNSLGLQSNNRVGIEITLTF